MLTPFLSITNHKHNRNSGSASVITSLQTNERAIPACEYVWTQMSLVMCNVKAPLSFPTRHLPVVSGGSFMEADGGGPVERAWPALHVRASLWPLPCTYMARYDPVPALIFLSSSIFSHCCSSARLSTNSYFEFPANSNNHHDMEQSRTC